jgi:hypothetical protein
MDLENIRDGEISWISRLRKMSGAMRIVTSRYERLGEEDGAGAFERPPLDKFRRIDAADMTNIRINGEGLGGRAITLTEAVLPVEAGEIIGYNRKGEDGNNYIHWEVFTAERGLFEEMNRIGGEDLIRLKDINSQSADGVLAADELSDLFGAGLIESLCNTIESNHLCIGMNGYGMNSFPCWKRAWCSTGLR